MEASLHELVRRTVALFQQHPEAEHWDIVKLLREQGIKETCAEELAVWVPSAFCRVLFEDDGPKYWSYYDLYNPDTEERATFPLEDQAVFHAACDVARQWLAAGGDQRLFRAIAARSAEYAVISDFLAQGSKPGSLRLTSPLIFTSASPPSHCCCLE